MYKKETHKLATGYRGKAFEILTAGNQSAPYADPALTVISQEGFAPNGLDVVSSVSIAVGINSRGFLQPCDGKIKPYGVIAHSLLGTACIFEEDPTEYSSIPTLTNGALTGTESLHQLIPTVYQNCTLFEAGIAFKTDGASADLFKIEIGDLLRPITKEEIDAAIADETLPILFKNETTSNCPKTKAVYAGKLVKFDSTKDDYAYKVGRAMAFRDPAQYDNIFYKGAFVFDYDLQGPSTAGNSRGVWNLIGPVYGKEGYTTTIMDFYVAI